MTIKDLEILLILIEQAKRLDPIYHSPRKHYR